MRQRVAVATIQQWTADWVFVVENRSGNTWSFPRSALPSDVPLRSGEPVTVEVFRDVTLRRRTLEDPRASGSCT